MKIRALRPQQSDARTQARYVTMLLAEMLFFISMSPPLPPRLPPFAAISPSPPPILMPPLTAR